MTVDHRRPLIAFICVTVLCALVMFQTTLYVVRSPWGGGLSGVRGLVASIGGFGTSSPAHQVVAGSNLAEVPELPPGVTDDVEVSPVVAATGSAPASEEDVAEVATTVTVSTHAAPPVRGQERAGSSTDGPRGNADTGGRDDAGRDEEGEPPVASPEEPRAPGSPSALARQIEQLLVLAATAEVDLEAFVVESERPQLVELAQLLEEQVESEEPITRVELVELAELVEPRQVAKLEEITLDAVEEGVLAPPEKPDEDGGVPPSGEKPDESEEQADAPTEGEESGRSEPVEAPTPLEPTTEPHGSVDRRPDAAPAEPGAVGEPEPAAPAEPATAPEPAPAVEPAPAPPAPVESAAPVEPAVPGAPAEPADPPVPTEQPAAIAPVAPPTPEEPVEPTEPPEQPAPVEPAPPEEPAVGDATGAP